MLFLAEKLKGLDLGWNEKPWTEDDFHQCREAQGIFLSEIEHDAMLWKAFYTVCEGVPTIVVNARLRGIERLHVLLHELGHHLLHAPATCFFSDDMQEKIQFEAEAFAVCALVPESLLRKLLASKDYVEDYGFPAELLRCRLKVLELYGV
jgi:Zn-dependent peptidase ImmA (M78 family)